MAFKFSTYGVNSFFIVILILMKMIFLGQFTYAHDFHDNHHYHKKLQTSSSSSSSSSSNHSKPFEFLKQLEGIKKGDRNQAIRDLKKYLQQFGYLNPTKTLNQLQTHSLDQNHHMAENGLVISTNHDDHFDDLLEIAIKTYQINYNLEPSGALDSKTLTKMMMPRCAVADFVDERTRMRSKPNKNSNINNIQNRKLLGSLQMVSRYAFFSGEPRWPSNKQILTYGFKEETPAEATEAVDRAFKTWASSTRFKFSRARSEQNPDIRVSFERGDHGDGQPFDRDGGILAHAFSPTDGRLHFNADKSWSVGVVADYFDVETVALHEIGHILGLMHSSVEDAIMYPQIGSGVTKGLNEDDINGINDLYNVLI